MLKTAKVVGLNSDNEAALALISSGGDSSTFFFAVALCSLEDAFTKVRQALFEAESEFTSSSQSLSERLLTVFTSIKNLLPEAEKLEVILATVDEDESGTVLYLMESGESLTATLLREGNQTDLGKVSQGEVVSGILQEGDRIIMSTKSLIDFLGKDFSKLAAVPLESFEDEVLAHLPEAEVYPMAAIAVEKERVITEDAEAAPLSSKLTSDSRRISVKEAVQSLGRILPRSKKGLALIAIPLLVLGLLGFFLTYQKQQSDIKVRLLQSNLDQVSQFLSQAKLLKDTEPQQAIAKLIEADNILSQVLKSQPQHTLAVDLQKQIKDTQPEIFKIYEVADLSLWLELSLIKPELTSDHLSLSLGKILFLDENKKVAVTVSLENKSPQTLAGEEKLGEALLASLNGDLVWIYSKDKGMVRISGEEVKSMIKSDTEWGSVLDIVGFANNLYVLDSGKNQIWKYLPIVSGYAEKREYFKSEVKTDLSSALKMHIDSSIWILKRGGELLKFTQGSPDFFAFSGLDKPVSDPKSFFVSDKTENLYLLDSGNSRLLVLDKKGVYKAQYTSDKFKDFIDLVVDETGKKVYLLDGNKIFSLDLR